MASYQDLITAIRAATTSGQLNDAFWEYTSAQGYTGSIDDRLQEMFRDLGLTGTFNDMLQEWDGNLVGAASALLLEDGTSNLLLEDGTSNLLLG